MFIKVEKNKILNASNWQTDKDYIETEFNYNLFIKKPHGYYIFEDNRIVENPDYEREKNQYEENKIKSLTMTKRIFALELQKYGITYSDLKNIISTNEQAQLEWDLCIELQRANPLLDVMGAKLNIKPEQIDEMFIMANSKNEKQESGK